MHTHQIVLVELRNIYIGPATQDFLSAKFVMNKLVNILQYSCTRLPNVIICMRATEFLQGLHSGLAEHCFYSIWNFIFTFCQVYDLKANLTSFTVHFEA